MIETKETVETRQREAKHNLRLIATVLFSQQIISERVKDEILKNISSVIDNPFQILDDLIGGEVIVDINGKTYSYTLIQKEL